MNISYGVVFLFLVTLSTTNFVSSQKVKVSLTAFLNVGGPSLGKANSAVKPSCVGSKDGSSCPQPNLNQSIPFKPKSCLDYLKKNRHSQCGVFNIYDNAGNSFPVYCDMKTEPGNAWTLVVSWSNKKRAMSLFRSFVFKQNAPVNENAPNFNLYRQTLSRMQSLKSHSTHWRATCSYPTHGVDYRDYVRGNFKDFDILTFLGAGVCKKVEYINIRGHVGIHTTVKWWQEVNTCSLHTDSSSVYRGCGGFTAVAGSVREEDNFGHYYFINPKFRCTANDNSTTQWWFGGHL